MNSQKTANQLDFQKVALETLRIEENALQILATQIDGRFSRACEIILQCTGRLVITGIGKSGHIGRKWRRPLLRPEHPHSLCIRVKPVMATWACWSRVMC